MKSSSNFMSKQWVVEFLQDQVEKREWKDQEGLLEGSFDRPGFRVAEPNPNPIALNHGMIPGFLHYIFVSHGYSSRLVWVIIGPWVIIINPCGQTANCSGFVFAHFFLLCSHMFFSPLFSLFIFLPLTFFLIVRTRDCYDCYVKLYFKLWVFLLIL